MQNHRIGDALHRRLFGMMSALPGRASTGLLRGYFEWFHRRPDPWGHAVLDYEQRKYAATLDAVPPGDYRRILDVGCSEGTFTAQLAGRYPAAEIVGVDISARALERARRRLAAAGDAAVRFDVLDIVTHSPAGRFDLVFCAETLYYLGRGERSRLAAHRLGALLEPAGLLVLVHPWPEARALYAELDTHPALTRHTEEVVDDPTRPFAVTTYRCR